MSFVEFYDVIQNLKKNQQHAILFVYLMFHTCNQEISASSSITFAVYCDKENKQLSVITSEIGLRSNS